MSQDVKFEDFINYMRDLDLLPITGKNNVLFNDKGAKIGEMINPHYTEGIVKSHFQYVECIRLLIEIKKMTSDEAIKNKIEQMLLAAINL